MYLIFLKIYILFLVTCDEKICYEICCKCFGVYISMLELLRNSNFGRRDLKRENRENGSGEWGWGKKKINKIKD